MSDRFRAVSSSVLRLIFFGKQFRFFFLEGILFIYNKPE